MSGRSVNLTTLFLGVGLSPFFWTVFGSGLYRQIVGVPMGTNCAPLVADLFLFC